MGDVLHRFNWVFDYQSQQVAFKKNKYFKAPFKYNKSGIVMQYAGVRLVKKQIRTSNGISDDPSGLSGSQPSNTINFSYNYTFEIVPELIISDLRPDSSAYIAGLKIGDVVLSINNQDLSSLTLQKSIEQFYGKDGKLIRMTIDRGGILFKYQFRLRDLLHKKSTN